MRGQVAAIAASLALSACAGSLTRADFWHLTHAPQTVKEVAYSFTPCGNATWYGCFDRKTGIIWLRPDMSKERTECVRKHEEKHAAGYDHDDEGLHFVTDCGDGTVF